MICNLESTLGKIYRDVQLEMCDFRDKCTCPVARSHQEAEEWLKELMIFKS